MNPMKNREKMIEVSKPNFFLSIDSLIYWPLKCELAGLLIVLKGTL